MKIVMVGTGYVGLVSGACLAETGHDVVCVDRDETRIAELRAGRVPIYEPGLELVVRRNMAAGRLSFAAAVADAAGEADAFFIAVGTPPRIGGGEADLAHVRAAAAEIARCARPGAVVVTKSTVPVGTGDQLAEICRTVRGRHDVEIVSNPEFLREGSAVEDFMTPDRIVVGAEAEAAHAFMRRLYAPMTKWGVPLVATSRRTAEVIKYAANAFLAIKISFINEMADFCEATAASIAGVAHGIGFDHRIGATFLNPGPGYGGSCFPKDSMALLATAQSHSVPLRLVESTIAVNEARKRMIGRRVVNAMGGSGYGKKVAVLGLAFKAGTDDVRESPAISIIAAIQASGAEVSAHDPEAMRNAAPLLRDVTFAEDPYACALGADCIVLVTDWDEFGQLDAGRLGALVRRRVLVDLRNALDPAPYFDAGFEVLRIGHGTVLDRPAAPRADAPAADAAPRRPEGAGSVIAVARRAACAVTDEC